ncbi:hypothetical protein R5R35_003183 [Gryllus longicercus]|uniref:Uncharacterized protein n=1 Tax=Gryllus longicercus TaxID=2509291 RepID=A0AAN9VL27_9ORTH
MELARLPELDTKNISTHQPLAMCRFLARELGLAGNDEWEALYIDATVDELCALKARKFCLWIIYVILNIS